MSYDIEYLIPSHIEAFHGLLFRLPVTRFPCRVPFDRVQVEDGLVEHPTSLSRSSKAMSNSLPGAATTVQQVYVAGLDRLSAMQTEVSLTTSIGKASSLLCLLFQTSWGKRVHLG